MNQALHSSHELAGAHVAVGNLGQRLQLLEVKKAVLDKLSWGWKAGKGNRTWDPRHEGWRSGSQEEGRLSFFFPAT
jgi:hypothetical protein